jgi:hypothetical protein
MHKNITNLIDIMLIRGNLAAKHGISYFLKLISLVFQQADHITGITNAVIVLICSVNKLHAINGFSIKVTDISYYWHRRQEQQ